MRYLDTKTKPIISFIYYNYFYKVFRINAFFAELEVIII